MIFCLYLTKSSEIYIYLLCFLFYRPMLFIYTFLVKITFFFLPIYAKYSAKIAFWLQNQRTILNHLPLTKTKKRVWLHCASLGEFEQVRPLIAQIRMQTHFEIVVSFFSASGYEQRKKDPLIDVITYYPIDLPSKILPFLQRLQPDYAIFVKYEFWWNMLAILHKQKIPTFLVAGVLHSQQPFFWPIIGRFFVKYLHYFDYMFLQNQASFALAQKLGLKNAAVFGDPRCDNVWQRASAHPPLPIVEQFKALHPNKLLLLLGSSWEEEEQLTLDYLAANEVENCPYIVLIAPHDVSPTHLLSLKKELEKRKINYASWGDTQLSTPTRVLLLDRIGFLLQAYLYADVAFVGGAFKKGLHNILEPAVFGAPILMGPHIQKFQEAVDLLVQGAALTVRNADELSSHLQLLTDAKTRKEMGSKGHHYILQNRGATQNILKTLHLH